MLAFSVLVATTLRRVRAKRFETLARRAKRGFVLRAKRRRAFVLNGCAAVHRMMSEIEMAAAVQGRRNLERLKPEAEQDGRCIDPAIVSYIPRPSTALTPDRGRKRCSRNSTAKDTGTTSRSIGWSCMFAPMAC